MSTQNLNEEDRLLIDESDVERLIPLAIEKGYKDDEIKTFYVAVVEGDEDDDGGVITKEALLALEKATERLIYDEVKKRLVGFIPPSSYIVKNVRKEDV